MCACLQFDSLLYLTSLRIRDNLTSITSDELTENIKASGVVVLFLDSETHQVHELHNRSEP